jgi:transcriptional regulator with XRE-family HTH domain
VNSEIFGKFIAKIRKEKNITQADLANELGVTDKAVSRWERGKGFPDINTLEPLSSALGITVLELMRSEKADMKNKKLSESEITEIVVNAVEMERENQKQDKMVTRIGLVTTFIIAILVKLWSHSSVGGAVFVGAVAALFTSGVYLYIKNKHDPMSRKIYAVFMLIGIGLCLELFHFIGINPFFLVWGVYGVFCIVIMISSK